MNGTIKLKEFPTFVVVVDKEGYLHMILEVGENEAKNGRKYKCFNLLTRDITTIPGGSLKSYYDEAFNPNYWNAMIPETVRERYYNVIPKQYSNALQIAAIISRADKKYWIDRCMESICAHFDPELTDEDQDRIRTHLDIIHRNDIFNRYMGSVK